MIEGPVSMTDYEKIHTQGYIAGMQDFANKLLEVYKDWEQYDEIFCGALRREIKKILEESNEEICKADNNTN